MTTPMHALPFPVTPRRPGEPEADLTGFMLVHRALRSGVRLLADATAGIAAGDPCAPGRRKAIRIFAGHVLHELHAHHVKEDEVLWPVIAISAGPHIDLAPLTDDHTAMQDDLDLATAALAVFDRDARGGAGDLAAVLTRLADELDQHIADEEAAVFPVLRTHVSKADYARCEEQFTKGTSFGHLRFMVPWLFDQCTPGELAELLPTAPRPVVVLERLTRGRWRRRRDLVRGRS